MADKAIDCLCMLLFIPIFGIFVVLCNFPEIDRNHEESECETSDDDYELDRFDTDTSDDEE